MNIIYDKLVDAIVHSKEYSLPLKSIELEEHEWAEFVTAPELDQFQIAEHKVLGHKQMQFRGITVFTRGKL